MGVHRPDLNRATIRTRRDHGAHTLSLLVCSLLTEGISSRGHKWHDTLWSLRHALFIVLPLTIHLLPAPYAPPPLRYTLQDAAHAADVLLARTHLLRLGTAGTQRVPELRERAAAFWTREQGVGEAVRQDAGVRVAAERSGLGLSPGVTPKVAGEDGAEGTLHKAARGAVEALKDVGLRPPAA